ncbi:MAG TPA: serine hydrolase domain-containing protein, partial [Actinopolymorphaceae bacterium]
MSRLDDVRTWLTERLPSLLTEHEVPGASVAVLADDEIVEVAGGVLHKHTGVEVTTDSVFHVGSITKVWTATLIMQLVDEGRLDLDAPVRTYLPKFRVADEHASATVTTRHLLNHTAGWEGDIFTPTTSGDDAVERFVDDIMPTVRQTLPPGEMFSYNNAGFVVLGRIIEVLREKPWAQVLRERLAEPLGLEYVATRADEAILFRAAVGHVQADPADEPTPTKVWALPYSNAPFGAMLAMSARDLLGFARLHLCDGLAPDGTRLLSESAAAEMRAPFAEVPRLTPRPTQRGLGWSRYDWDGGLVVGHDGQTIGQLAYLRVVPERGVAVAVLTNGGRAGRLHTAVTSEALRVLAGIAVPPLPGVPPGPVDAVDRPERYVGRYEVHSGRVDVEVDDEGRLWMT